MGLLADVADGIAQLDTAAAPPLPALTDEDVTAILTQLPLSQLPACAAACSQWARCVRSDGLLWSAGFASRFGGTVAPADARLACRRCLSTLSTLKLQPCSVGAESGSGSVGLRPRAGAAVGSLGPYVVLSGGATSGFEVTRSIDVWDSRTQRVVGSGVDKVQRWQHSALSCRDEVWLYGGTDSRSHRPCTFLHALHLSELPSGWVGDSYARLDASQLESPALLEHDSGEALRTVCQEVRMEAEPEAELETEGEGEPTEHRSAEEDQRWVEGPPALSGHAVTLLGGGTADAAMLVFGGQRRGRGHAAEDPVTNLLWRATLPSRKPGAHTRDPSRWRTVHASGSPPSPRFCHASERVGDAWLILFGWAKNERHRDGGGRRQFNASGARPFLSDLHRLRLDTMVWEAVAPAGAVPRGRCQAVAVASPDEQMLLIFGGARHADPEPGQQYGDMVVDLSDVGLLHLPTLTWLPPAGLPTNFAQRGGTNALVRAPGGRCFIFGGMNSDAGNDMPHFLNAMTEVVGLGDGQAGGPHTTL